MKKYKQLFLFPWWIFRLKGPVLFFFILSEIISCAHRTPSPYGVVVPAEGFPGYKKQKEIEGGGPLRFDGLYCRKFVIKSSVNPKITAEIIAFYRLWPNGCIMQGRVPKQPLPGTPVEFPTASDGDTFYDAIVGKYKYDSEQHVITVKMYTCAPSGWVFIETKYRCTEDGRFIVISSSAKGGWGGQEEGIEWKFLELPGMKQNPFW